MPLEIQHFELMHPDGMGWSWPELDATPVYVRRYCWDLLNIRREAQAEANKPQGRPPDGH